MDSLFLTTYALQADSGSLLVLGRLPRASKSPGSTCVEVSTGTKREGGFLKSNETRLGPSSLAPVGPAEAVTHSLLEMAALNGMYGPGGAREGQPVHVLVNGGAPLTLPFFRLSLKAEPRGTRGGR